MKHNIKNSLKLMTGFILTLTCFVGTAFASPRTYDVLNQPSRYNSNEKYYLSYKDTSNNASEDFFDKLNCNRYDLCESGRVWHFQDNSEKQSYLLESELQQIINDTEFCDSKIATLLPSIVPDHTELSEGINMIISYISNNMTYDDNALENMDLLRYYQSAKPFFTDHKGVCSTFSHTFHLFVNQLPTKDGVVDYENGTARSDIECDYVINNAKDHAYNRINYNGSYKWFDLTGYNAMNEAGKSGDSFIWQNSPDSFA